jgi:bla regulator protein blaR1
VEPSDSPFLMKALEEQLGLKLVPAKGARAVIVVDHVELPAKN